MEKGVGEKIYAPGVGLVKDDEVLLTKTGANRDGKKGAEDEEEESKVKLSDCPAAVQKTLEREAHESGSTPWTGKPRTVTRSLKWT